MRRCALLAAVLLVLLSSLSDGGLLRKNGACPWFVRRGTHDCGIDKFRCLDEKCVPSHWYCDGGNDCSDHSDELYCDTTKGCPEEPPFVKCRGSNKCIPLDFVGDNKTQCPGGTDEIFPGEMHFLIADDTLYRAMHWLQNTYKKSEPASEMWGQQVDKLAVALHLANETSSKIKQEMISEVSIRLLSRLARYPLTEIPSNELASFLNALVVLCLDPRTFHGMDIVQELRSRPNLANPYVLLALCNAGEFITEVDKKNLIEIFSNKKRAFWTDMQAYVVMALVCAHRQPGSDVDSETIFELTKELKHQQYRNGSLEDLQATALVLQALFAAESDEDRHFDEAEAMKQIRKAQKQDGSFKNFMDVYYIFPVLNCKSLAHIGTDHCPQNVNREEHVALQKLMDLSEPKIRVQYSLWIGDGREMEWYIALRVPANSTFYRVMELAADIDSRYRFEYVVKNRKPYVTAIHEMRENVEIGKFWLLYTIKEGMPKPATESPVDLVPGNNDHLAMWYRSGSWIE